jgi:hypothetical protein
MPLRACAQDEAPLRAAYYKPFAHRSRARRHAAQPRMAPPRCVAVAPARGPGASAPAYAVPAGCRLSGEAAAARDRTEPIAKRVGL